MLQNKFSFNQSSASLEIIGLPDLSNNEDKDNISIVSKWNLKIIDKPLIEGTVDHLDSIIKAFYAYSFLLINEEKPSYESKLIDIKTENFYVHDLLLKSSKPNIKPLNIKIGNAGLSDIINCFDQLKSSNKIKFKFKPLRIKNKKNNYSLLNKNKISRLFIPPIISLLSLFITSCPFIFYYKFIEYKENKVGTLKVINFSNNKSIKLITKKK